MDSLVWFCAASAYYLVNESRVYDLKKRLTNLEKSTQELIKEVRRLQKELNDRDRKRRPSG